MKNRYNYQEYDEGFLQMEKRATNKKGIIIILIIMLALIGGSVFYFSRNGISFEFNLPWQTEEKIENKKKKEEEKEETKIKNKLDAPVFNDQQFYTAADYMIEFSDFHKSNLGFDADITFSTTNNPRTVILEKVLVDGYDTTTTFTKSLNPLESITQTIRINQVELDALDIVTFGRIALYFKVLDSEGKSEVKLFEMNASNKIDVDNSRKGLIEIDNKNNTKISYYKLLEDKDNSYLYFDFKNTSLGKSQIIAIKKLMINGKIYDYKSLKEEIYHGAEKIVSLTIPKSDYKKITSFAISFVMFSTDENGKMTEAYITNEYSRSL